MSVENNGSIRYPGSYAFLVIAILAIVLASISFGLVLYQRTNSIASIGPTVESITKLKELVTLKVTIGDVLTGQTDSIFGAKMALVVSGDALVSVDLSKVVISQNNESKSAHIRLAVPRVLMARVNQEKTGIYDVKSNSIVAIITGDRRTDLLKTCMESAQKLVERAASNEENIQHAKDQAEMIIKQLYSELGWTINIDWSSQ